MKKILLLAFLGFGFFSYGFASIQPNYSSEELQKAIDWMYENGLTRYNTPTDFMSNDPINREQASKFFGVIAEDIYKKGDISGTNCTFKDIKKADSTLQGNIVDACKLGIFKGYKQTFDPKRHLTNAEGLAVLTRIVDYMPSENQNPWYKKYYDMVLFRGIINVDGLRLRDEGFAQQKTTRGEIAVMIYRTYQIKIEKEKTEKEKPDIGTEKKEEIDESYERTYPPLLPEYSINFSHDFSNASSLTEDKKQMIRSTFDLAFGNALQVMKSGGLLNQKDIERIKQIPIDHFNGDRTDVLGYCKTSSRYTNGGGVSNSFAGFGYATYPSYDITSLEEYYKSPYIQHIFYHEVGHYIDLTKNQGARGFWDICRINIHPLGMKGDIKSQCDDDAFVEDYGMTIPVEDFATVFAINFYPKISYTYTRGNAFLQQKFTFLNSLINKVYAEVTSCPVNQHVEYGICEPNQRVCDEGGTDGYQERDANTLSWNVCQIPPGIGFINTGGSNVGTTTQCNDTQYLSNGSCVNNIGCVYGTLVERVRCIGSQTNQDLNQNISGNTRECFDYGPIKNDAPAKGYGIQTLENGIWGACMLNRCSGGCENNVPGGCTLVQNSCFITKKSCVDTIYDFGITRSYFGYSFLQDNLSYGVCVPDNTTRLCDITHGIGERTWANDARGPCGVTSCNTGYFQNGNICTIIPICAGTQHLENNVCINNVRPCIISNGIGQEIWNGEEWRTCTAISCNEGYDLSGILCDVIIP